MAKSGLMVTFEARPGKEIELEEFLESGLHLLNGNRNSSLYAMRVGHSSYAIIDTSDGKEQQPQTDAEFSKALYNKAGHLFASNPKVQPVHVLASMNAN
jgi:hypothetical protein